MQKKYDVIYADPPWAYGSTQKIIECSAHVVYIVF